MDAVAVGGAQHVRARRVNSRVDHERRRVEQPAGSAIDHFPGVADLDQIGGFDLRKGDAKRVHPEGGRVDGVAQGDVSGDA